MLRRFLLCLLTAGLVAGGSGNQAFQDGDVVGFWGDSITHAEYSEINYTHVLYNYYVTHFPEKEIELRNLGVGGARISHGLDLYEKDPAARGLTKVVLEYGINVLKKYLYEEPEFYEGGEEAREENLEDFRENLNAFLETLQEDGIESNEVFATSLTVPYFLTSEGDQDQKESQARLQEGYENISDISREFARERETGFFEFREPLTELLENSASDNQESLQNIIMQEDGVHLNTNGHIYLAYLFLEQQGALEDVSRVEAGKNGIHSDDAEVSNFHYEDGYLYYDYQAKRLPMGVSHEYFEADESLHILDKLNREIIQVQDLQKDAIYNIYINGEKIGSYSGAEFAEGVNIANIRENPSQMYARAVEQMNRGRRVSELKYRKVVQNFTDCGSGETTEEELTAAFQTWQEEDAEYRQSMYELVRERIQATERVAIVREDVEAPEAAFAVPGSNHKEIVTAVFLAAGAALFVVIWFGIRRRKRNNIDKQHK